MLVASSYCEMIVFSGEDRTIIEILENVANVKVYRGLRRADRQEEQ